MNEKEVWEETQKKVWRHGERRRNGIPWWGGPNGCKRSSL